MYYIGIDVSKKDLSVFDGRDLNFINKEGLKSFKKYLKKKYHLQEIAIIFEPTGIYSLYLKEFCAENSIKTYIVNPKKSHNFTRALGRCSKTDKIDARILYQFHKLIEAKDIKIPKIDQQAKTLASYLVIYEFALKQRVALSNHLESLRDRELITLKIFYLPTICATVHNQKIRVFYQRLLAHHKTKKLAVIASMRKILLIAHTMYRDKTEYVST